MKPHHQRLFDRAETQHGVVTRRDAREAGLHESAIDQCLRGGSLVSVAAGVYRVRGALQTEMMALSAATLVARGRLSHTSAARALRLVSSSADSQVHVTIDVAARRCEVTKLVVTDRDHEFYSLRAHRSIDVAGQVISVDGLPCVDPPRALIDLAASVSGEQLEAAFERGRALGLLTPASLGRRFAQCGGKGRPGSAKIRELLATTAPGSLDSRLEVKAWRLLRTSGLALPARQMPVAGTDGKPRYRLDFAWPDVMVAFEPEGFEWHGTRGRWKQDRVRTAYLERQGWRVVVATWDDVVKTPEATLHRLRLALDERRRLQGSLAFDGAFPRHFQADAPSVVVSGEHP